MAMIVSTWGEYGARPDPSSVNAELFADLAARVGLDVNCTPAAAWALVTDVTRIGDFSPECVGARWTGSSERPSVGARFDGTNRKTVGADELTWVRPCTVVVCDPGRAFGYVVGDRYDGSPAHTGSTSSFRPPLVGAISTSLFATHPMGRAACATRPTPTRTVPPPSSPAASASSPKACARRSTG